MSSQVAVADALRALAASRRAEAAALEALAEAALQPTNEDASGDWIDGHTAARLGLMSRRTFLDCAKRGLFPASKSGRKHIARRADVEAFLASQRIGPKAPQRARCATPNASDDVDAKIAELLDRGRLRPIRGGKP